MAKPKPKKEYTPSDVVEIIAVLDKHIENCEKIIDPTYPEALEDSFDNYQIY